MEKIMNESDVIQHTLQVGALIKNGTYQISQKQIIGGELLWISSTHLFSFIRTKGSQKHGERYILSS